MIEYYTDSAAKSLWVLTIKNNGNYYDYDTTLTCFAAQDNSGFHIGQQVHNPKLENSNWKPLSGEILVSEVLS